MFNFRYDMTNLVLFSRKRKVNHGVRGGRVFCKELNSKIALNMIGGRVTRYPKQLRFQCARRSARRGSIAHLVSAVFRVHHKQLKEFFIDGDDVNDSTCDPFVSGWLVPVAEDGLPKNSVILQVREVAVPFQYTYKLFLRTETIKVNATVWQLYLPDAKSATIED